MSTREEHRKLCLEREAAVELFNKYHNLADQTKKLIFSLDQKVIKLEKDIKNSTNGR
jgi:hypothetical protein